VFKVKIASDAIVALTTLSGNYDGDIYEIVIGGSSNKVSWIRLAVLKIRFIRGLQCVIVVAEHSVAEVNALVNMAIVWNIWDIAS
jgi:hypothetical protein